jgi:large subunit ribosomal protein L6
MSRIGKMIMEVPSGTTLEYKESENIITVKGVQGVLSLNLPHFVKVIKDRSAYTIKVDNENDKKQRACWGTYRALVNNMIVGVSAGFKREMELNGVGYKMELSGSLLTLYIGYSHSVKVQVPPTIKLVLNKNVIAGESIDKQCLGDFFMKIHNMKPCDVYKQKGFKIPGRFYRKKVGKKAK